MLWSLSYLIGFVVFSIFAWKKRLPTLTDFSVSVFWPITGIAMAFTYGVCYVMLNMLDEVEISSSDSESQESAKPEV